MFSKPKILVGTDFSYASDLALKMAEDIRRKTGGSIKLVYYSHDSQGLLDQVNQSMKEQIERCQIDCSFEIIHGSAFEEMQKTIAEMKPDLLVLGRHGKSALLHLGSLTQKLIASSDVPVLVVNKIGKFNDVAGLIDPATPSKKTIAAAEELSYLLSSKLELMSVIPDIDSLSLTYVPYLKTTLVFSEEEKNTIRNRLTEEILQKSDPHAKATIKVEITHKKIPEALLELLRYSQVDFAVMTRHNRGVMEKIFIGSVTRGVLEGFKGNLLVLPE